jgi:hypothetical protein
MEIEKALQNSFGLTGDELTIVLPFFKLTQYEKGSFFLREGRPVDRLGFIKDGITREYFQSQDKEITKFIGCPGNFISDVSGINFSTASRWSIQAVTDCRIYT